MPEMVSRPSTTVSYILLAQLQCLRFNDISNEDVQFLQSLEADLEEEDEDVDVAGDDRPEPPTITVSIYTKADGVKSSKDLSRCPQRAPLQDVLPVSGDSTLQDLVVAIKQHYGIDNSRSNFVREAAF
jgi:hypothetical protein